MRGLCAAGIWQLLLHVLQLRQATALSYTNKRVGLSREPQIARSWSAQLSADPAVSRRLPAGDLQWPFQLQFLSFCEGFLYGVVPVYYMFVCYSDKNNMKNLCDIFLRFIKVPFVFAVNLFLFILPNLTFFYSFLSQNVMARHY